MARARTNQRQPALDATARKRAFLVAAGAIAAAAGVMLALGAPDREEQRVPEPEPERRVVGGNPAGQPTSPLERAPDAAELRDARVAAARFARAFMARESGRFGPVIRHQLRATASPRAWQLLRQPLRTTPSWRPPRSRFERVAGLSETELPGLVEATVAFRRGEQQGYLSLLMSREGGRWHATPKGL